MVVLDFILFEISIQLELIYKKKFILIRNSFKMKLKRLNLTLMMGVSILILLHRIQIVRISVGVVLIE